MAKINKVVDVETGEIYMVPDINDYEDKIPGNVGNVSEASETAMAENYERNTAIVELTEKVAALEAENALLKKEPNKKEDARTEELKEYLDSIDLDEYNFSSPLVPEENVGWSKDSKLILKFGGTTLVLTILLVMLIQCGVTLPFNLEYGLGYGITLAAATFAVLFLMDAQNGFRPWKALPIGKAKRAKNLPAYEVKKIEMPNFSVERGISYDSKPAICQAVEYYQSLVSANEAKKK